MIKKDRRGTEGGQYPLGKSRLGRPIRGVERELKDES